MNNKFHIPEYGIYIKLIYLHKCFHLHSIFWNIEYNHESEPAGHSGRIKVVGRRIY